MFRGRYQLSRRNSTYETSKATFAVRQYPSKILRELGHRRALRQDLVMDAAQERFVDQFVRIQVGRKDDERHERQLELLACRQGQKVDSAFERHDPPVEQITRRTLLPAEVVDDEHAAVCHRLNRRAVEAGSSRVAQIKRRELQFPADHDHRPLAPRPAPVVAHARRPARTLSPAVPALRE